MTTVVLLDDFSRADLGTLAPNGQPYIGADEWMINTEGGNHGLRPIAGLPAHARLVHETYRSNVTVKLKHLDGPYGNNSTGVILRYTDDTHFVRCATANGTESVCVLSREGSSGGSIIASIPITSVGADDELSVEAVGNTYTIRINGALIDTVDDDENYNIDATIHGIYYFPSFITTPSFQGYIASSTIEYDRAEHITVHTGPALPGIITDTEQLAVHSGETWLGWIDEFDALTDAPNGQPYSSSANWSIVDGVLIPTVGADNYRVVDTFGTDMDIRTRVVEQGENTGIVFRWTDPVTYLWAAVGDPPGSTPPTVYLYTRAGGYGIAAQWNNVNPTAPYDLRVTLTGDEVRIFINGTDIGPPDSGSRTTTHNAGATKAGVMGAPHGAFEYLRWGATDFDIDFQIDAAGGHVAAHAATPIVQTPIIADGAHARLHVGTAIGGIIATPVHLMMRARSGRLSISTQTDNPAPGGSGRYPVGARADLGVVRLVDENGNYLVDENGNVLVFD